MDAGSYDAPQMTAEDRDPPPTRSCGEGRATPAETEDHQPRPQVSCGVDGVAKQIYCSDHKGSLDSPLDSSDSLKPPGRFCTQVSRVEVVKSLKRLKKCPKKATVRGDIIVFTYPAL